jgi:hypothetical protein
MAVILMAATGAMQAYKERPKSFERGSRLKSREYRFRGPALSHAAAPT